MRIFEFADYKAFVTYRIESMPQKGHGQYRKLALHLGVSTTFISHVFRGDRELSDEQALEVASFLNLNIPETDFFVLLVQAGRASTHGLKNYLKQKLKGLKSEALASKNRMQKDLELSENLQSTYYSQWYYGAIRTCCLLPGINTIPKLSQYLNLPIHVVEATIELLMSANLLKKGKGDSYTPVHQLSYLDKTSPLVSRHHTNWRTKAVENMVEINNEQEMFFTCPMTLSNDAVFKVRKIMVDVIEEVMNVSQKPPDETFYCLNIDWFRVKR